MQRYFSWRELKAILSMSLPSVAIYVSIMVMQISTMYFASRIGLRELSVFALSNGFFNLCFLFCIGLNVAGGVICGEHYGARNHKEVTQAGVQSIWVAFWGGALCIFLLPALPWMLRVSGQDLTLIDDVLKTTAIIAISLPFISVFSAIRNFLTSISHPYILLKIMPPALVLNVLLLFILTDVLDIGLVGLGLALVINNCILCVWSIVICYTDSNSRVYKIFHPKNIFVIDYKIMRSLLKVGIPSGLTILTESATFQLLLFMGGALGIVSLNALQIGIQINGLCLMIAVGIGQIVMARISNAAGAREYYRIALISGSSIVIITFIVLVFAAIILIFRESITLAFLSKADQSLFQQTKEITIQVLALTAFAQIVDSGQTTCAYCLRGIRDTKVPMYIVSLCYWIAGIIPAYFLGFVYNKGAVGIWGGFAFGILLTNIFLGIRSWNTMKKYSRISPLSLIFSHKPT